MPIIFKKPNIDTLVSKGYTCIDMHMHTNASKDAFSSIDKIIAKAKKNNFGVAITDHNEISSAVYAASNNQGVLVIPGIEVKAYSGIDIIIYFYKVEDLENFFYNDVKPFQKNNPFINDQTVEQIIARAKMYKCVIGAPHPFTPLDLGLGRAINKEIVSTNVLQDIDIIEVINGAGDRELNQEAMIWAEKHNKYIYGGSDSHTVITVGSVLTCLKLKPGEHFLDIIIKKEAKVIGKPRLFLGIVIGFALGNFKLLTFPKGWKMFIENLSVCFTLKRRKSQYSPSNILTLLRFFSIPFLIGFLFIDVYNSFLIAWLIFIAAVITDIIDGYIARKYDLQTKFGEIWDPITNRLVINSLLIALLYLDVINIFIVIMVFAISMFMKGLRGFVSTNKELLIKMTRARKIINILQYLAIFSAELFLVYSYNWNNVFQFNLNYFLYIANTLLILSVAVGLLGSLFYTKNIIFRKIIGK